MRNLLVILLIIQLFTCCISKNDKKFIKRNLIYEPIYIGLDKISTAATHADSLVKNVFYIKPEATENSLISQYDKILVCGDTLFILEKSNIQQKVFAFNINGDFLFSVDGRGKGPGEYRNISDFYIDCDNKYIGILDFSKVLKYNFNGEYIETIDLSKYNATSIIYANNTLSALTRPTDYFSKNCFGFASFSSDGELLYRDYPESSKMLSYPYDKHNYFCANSSATFFNSLNSDTVYEVGERYLIPRYVLDFGRYKLPDDVVDRLIAKGESELIESNHNYMGLDELIVTDDYVVFIYNIGLSLYIAIYSIKTSNIIYFSSLFNYDKYLCTIPGIRKFDNKRFCSITSISTALWLKNNEEYLGILDEPSKFDEHRLKRYEAIKDLTPNDNDVITVFELKDF